MSTPNGSERVTAEALPRAERWALVALLDARGWTIRQIAEHIRETDYTTARIRGLTKGAPHGIQSGPP